MATATTEQEYEETTLTAARVHDASRVLPLIGRILFSAIFLISTPTHFSETGIGYAAMAGVPFPNLFVPIAGVLALVGALSVLLGYKAKIGAWLLILFLVPVTFVMHRFWGDLDAQAAQLQMAHFAKNVAMIGGALFIAYFGAGPLSLDARAARLNIVSR